VSLKRKKNRTIRVRGGSELVTGLCIESWFTLNWTSNSAACITYLQARRFLPRYWMASRTAVRSCPSGHGCSDDESIWKTPTTRRPHARLLRQMRSEALDEPWPSMRHAPRQPVCRLTAARATWRPIGWTGGSAGLGWAAPQGRQGCRSKQTGGPTPTRVWPQPPSLPLLALAHCPPLSTRT